mmetsp:Transcript_20493/g.33254  ORF Transcript_20493/g.33254 Transcript_20493/m.33254 type:complete len:172 (+) Transcript_20493:683-1198(+)
MFVHVGYSSQNLMHYSCRFMLNEASGTIAPVGSSFNNLIEELTATAQIGDEMHVLSIFVYIDKLDDTLMLHFLQQYDFASEAAWFDRRVAFTNRFDCISLPCGAIDTFPYRSVVACAENLRIDMVLVFDVSDFSSDGRIGRRRGFFAGARRDWRNCGRIGVSFVIGNRVDA